MVDVGSGNVRALSTRTQYEYQPAFSPAGSSVAYLFPRGPGPISANRLLLAPETSGDGSVLAPGLDRDITSFVWLQDGTNVLAMAADGIGVGMWLIPQNGDAARRLDLGALLPGAVSTAKSGATALTASTATQNELYVMDSLSSTPRRLANFNTAVSNLDQGKPVEITWRAADGQRSDGVLTYPDGYVPGQKYPMVLRIHGGPEASSTVAYNTGRRAPLRVLAAAHGYITFEPNYRGSDNLGTDHEHAIFADPGERAVHRRDGGRRGGREAWHRRSLAHLRHRPLLRRLHDSVADRTRRGWKCAIVSDGVVDWKQEYDLSDTGNLAWTRDSLGGSPADPASAALYRDGSPITYATNMKTPTLIFSGTADGTVPATEAYELYHALADRKVPVRFVAIPTPHHFPSDPVRVEAYYRTTFEWLDHYLR